MVDDELTQNRAHHMKPPERGITVSVNEMPALARFRHDVGAPAVIGGVLTAEGDLELAVVGDRQRTSGEPATTDDRWHLGSCGKSMTAVLYGRLVERGLAEWGTPVRNLFPDLADEIDAGWQTPTIDDLLLCRAGVRANPSKSAMFASWRDVSSASDQRTGLVISALANAPRGAGSFRYSNVGYAVVGAAIDRLAGIPYEVALAVHVMDPLGVNSLGFGPPPDVCGHRPRLQLGPIVLGRGKPAPVDDVRSDNPMLLTPAGRMHLTLPDWARFQRIFLNRGAPLLAAETVDHLLRPPKEEPAAMAMGWAPAQADSVSYGMQGSNTMWAATALLDAKMQRAALIVVNDGRSRVLQRSAHLALSLL